MIRGRQSPPTHVIVGRVWYYVNHGSIDLVVSEAECEGNYMAVEGMVFNVADTSNA